MKRVIISLMVLILLMSPMNAYALTDEEAYAGNQLRTLGILQGYTDGTLRLTNNISRSEVATLTMRILGYENVEVLGTGKNFTDLATTHWAYQYIQNAYKLSVIQGYPNGTFKPNNNITYAEVVAIMVNALGEQNDLVGTWPNNYLDKAKVLGVIPANSNVASNRIVTRGEMALIVWDTLLVKN